MAKTIEEKRKEEEELRAAELIALKKRQLQDLKTEEEERLSKKRPKETAAKFAPSNASQTGWDAIIKAYKSEFDLEPGANGALVFPSMEKALEFFTKQATNGIKFFCTQYENDKALDFHVFSCGDGTCYQGTYAAIKSQLAEALLQSPDSKELKESLDKFEALAPSAPSNHASDMRAKIHGHRKTAEENEPAPSPKPTRG